ncbi:MAG: phage terminase large subunit [Clostridia bacterium]|nr:phage terminase large subunit [Clostridia bacterium]
MPEISKEQQILLLKAELAKRELARRSFADYLAYSHGASWKATKMSTYLANEVQAFLEKKTGNAYDILIIETPPQHGKSMTITESLPAWYMGKHPDQRVIIASYNEEFAERFCRRNKEKVQLFGANLFKVGIGSINRSTEFELDYGGGRLLSRGIMSGITGNPANLIVIDDPVKNMQEADSPTYRNRVWTEWQASIKSRLQAGGKVIVIMTPWHEDDLAARMLATEPNVRLIRLPVEAQENDPLSRQPGDSLCPELGKDNAWLADFKRSYIHDPAGGGPRAWTALYMCSPRIEGGNLVHRDWWRTYDPDETKLFGTEVISVDAAFKDAETNDYVSIQVWGKLRNDYYLRYCLNQHLDFPSTVAAIRTVKQLYPRATTVLIEDKANGSAIIQTLQREMYCIPVQPIGGKVARVNAISAAIESGHVFVPDPAKAPWVNDFIDQFTAFPNGAHDDMCFVAGTMIATPKGDKPIETLKAGDKVLTPFGVDTVVRAGLTGYKEVVTRRGLTGTPDHPVFTYEKGYVTLESLTGGVQSPTITLKEVIKWKYLKLLSSMASHTDLWELEDIISASPVPMQDVRVLKDCMSRFGNFIAERKFRKAMRFITKTATLSITTIATLSVYRVANTLRKLTTKLRTLRNILTRSGRSPVSGIGLKKDASGIGSTGESAWRNEKFSRSPASTVGKSSQQSSPTQSSAPTTAPSNTTITSEQRKRPESASGVEKSSLQSQRREEMEHEPVVEAVGCTSTTSAEKRAVYNLTVEKSHLYYAGGFLVHNCDAASQALNRLIYFSGELAPPPIDDETELRFKAEEIAFNDPNVLFDPYRQQGWAM